MPIAVIAVHPNQTIPPNLALGGMRIFSGVVECLFKGAVTGEVTRDTLTFNVGRVNLGTGAGPTAGCVMSLASFAYDGAVSNALWAVDGANVPAFVNEDRGTGTADLQVIGNLAVRGLNGVVLRVNYVVFHFPS
ncbi:MAG: hypothetical protein E6I88_14805 [Chloroflexi bacterium]|nr:MAG: hypothetical protein E6I88_14805 [Chloroflexota bacterium]